MIVPPLLSILRRFTDSGGKHIIKRVTAICHKHKICNKIWYTAAVIISRNIILSLTIYVIKMFWAIFAYILLLPTKITTTCLAQMLECCLFKKMEAITGCIRTITNVEE